VEEAVPVGAPVPRIGYAQDGRRAIARPVRLARAMTPTAVDPQRASPLNPEAAARAAMDPATVARRTLLAARTALDAATSAPPLARLAAAAIRPTCTSVRTGTATAAQSCRRTTYRIISVPRTSYARRWAARPPMTGIRTTAAATPRLAASSAEARTGEERLWRRLGQHSGGAPAACCDGRPTVQVAARADRLC
jgi:hypothetical protein